MATCKSCHAEILWIETRNLKKAPVDAKPLYLYQVKEGIGELIPVYVPHFSTCKGKEE